MFVKRLVRKTPPPAPKVVNSYKLTFAVSVGTSEDGAFLDAAEGLEKAPHVVL